jgi:hypothetical protein
VTEAAAAPAEPAAKAPAKKAVATPAAKKPAAKKAVAKPAAKKPAAKAPAAEAATLLDHPAPADMPGAPFAPPPAGTAAAPAAPDAHAKGHDVVSAAVQAANGLVQIGAGVARTILARLPRP